MKVGDGIKVDFSLPAARVVRALNNIIEWRGKPTMIRVDNGPEYVSSKLTEWAEKHKVTLCYIQPGNRSAESLQRFHQELLKRYKK